MLYFDRIDVSEGIEVNKTSASSLIFATIGIFLNYSFKFQPNVCNICHDFLLMVTSVSNIAILNIKGSNYHYIISGISRNKAIDLNQNADFTKKSKTL